MVARRAFVGPLGDDIPSIFPIVAGVLLFIGTMAYAASLVAEKNSYLEVRKTSLGLSYIVTERGQMKKADLETLCADKLRKFGTNARVKFLITLERECPGYVFETDPKTTYDPNTAYAACSNLDFDAIKPDEVAARSPVVLNYPVAVPCPDEGSFTDGFGMINVIVWR
ncbi:Uncharacterised protein [Candidatus Norongarragalina meridionalis]|nr:Uncharacterised protein [Candidatus Norongarragalina meridionalis]